MKFFKIVFRELCWFYNICILFKKKILVLFRRVELGKEIYGDLGIGISNGGLCKDSLEYVN